MWYLLDENKDPYPVSVEEGMKLQDDIDMKIVKQDKIGNVFISTVFLGLDHSLESNLPILFETMIFNGKHDQYQMRYATYKQAQQGHEDALNLVKESLKRIKDDRDT